MSDHSIEADLGETLRKLEALHARPGSEGERKAAGNALERLRARIQQLRLTEAPQEYRFSLPDQWSRSLFVALARRYGLQPYRRRGQRRNTVMLPISPSFLDETLWPEFRALDAALRQHLSQVTQRIIAQAVHTDVTEATERPDDDGAGARAREIDP